MLFRIFTPWDDFQGRRAVSRRRNGRWCFSESCFTALDCFFNDYTVQQCEVGNCELVRRHVPLRFVWLPLKKKSNMQLEWTTVENMPSTSFWPPGTNNSTTLLALPVCRMCLHNNRSDTSASYLNNNQAEWHHAWQTAHFELYLNIIVSVIITVLLKVHWVMLSEEVEVVLYVCVDIVVGGKITCRTIALGKHSLIVLQTWAVCVSV